MGRWKSATKNAVEPESKPRGKSAPKSLAEILAGPLLPAKPPRGVVPRARGYDPEIAAALVPLELESDVTQYRSRVRLAASRWLDRLIARAVTRAERRSRRLPWHVAHGVEWVMAQRRTIAYDVVRALTAHGAGEHLSRRLAEHAARRFPRDGVVIDPEENARRRPRLEGTNPRARGEHPRARGESPRQRGRSPRQLRDTTDAAAVAALQGAD